MSGPEHERAARMVDGVHRRNLVASWRGLREILGFHTGLDPAGLVFGKGEHGKPHLTSQPSLNFSLSHSGDIALLAVSDAFAIGADIERIRDIDHLDLAERYFHPLEAEAIKHSDVCGAGQAFFEFWTLKEAVLKATGLGLSAPLDSFVVGLSPPCLISSPNGAAPPGDWRLFEKRVGENYAMAVAVITGGREISLVMRGWPLGASFLDLSTA